MKTPFRAAIALIATSFLLPVSQAEVKPPNKKEKSSQSQKKGKDKAKPSKGDKNKGPGKGKPGGKKGPKVDFEKLRFIDKDQTSIKGFFHDHRSNDHGLPPGLAKNLKRGKSLPPGWQKKLQPGFILEEPWLNTFIPVSYDYFPGLTRPEDTRLYLYDDRLVRVYEPERRIIDVIILEGVKALLQ